MNSSLKTRVFFVCKEKYPEDENLFRHIGGGKGPHWSVRSLEKEWKVWDKTFQDKMWMDLWEC
jgi:hypothetical protein